MHIPKNRPTGISLAIALETVANAQRNPGIKIKIVDHHEGRIGDLYLCKHIDNIINKLKLDMDIIGDKELYLVNRFKG